MGKKTRKDKIQESKKHATYSHYFIAPADGTISVNDLLGKAYPVQDTYNRILTMVEERTGITILSTLLKLVGQYGKDAERSRIDICQKALANQKSIYQQIFYPEIPILRDSNGETLTLDDLEDFHQKIETVMTSREISQSDARTYISEVMNWIMFFPIEESLIILNRYAIYYLSKENLERTIASIAEDSLDLLRADAEQERDGIFLKALYYTIAPNTKKNNIALKALVGDISHPDFQKNIITVLANAVIFSKANVIPHLLEQFYLYSRRLDDALFEQEIYKYFAVVLEQAFIRGNKEICLLLIQPKIWNILEPHDRTQLVELVLFRSGHITRVELLENLEANHLLSLELYKKIVYNNPEEIEIINQLLPKYKTLNDEATREATEYLDTLIEPQVVHAPKAPTKTLKKKTTENVASPATVKADAKTTELDTPMFTNIILEEAESEEGWESVTKHKRTKDGSVAKHNNTPHKSAPKPKPTPNTKQLAIDNKSIPKPVLEVKETSSKIVESAELKHEEKSITTKSQAVELPSEITFGDFGKNPSITPVAQATITKEEADLQNQALQQEIAILHKKLTKKSSLPKQNHKLKMEIKALNEQLFELHCKVDTLTMLLTPAQQDLPIAPILQQPDILVYEDRVVYFKQNPITGEVIYEQYLSPEAEQRLQQTRAEVLNNKLSDSSSAKDSVKKPTGTSLSNSAIDNDFIKLAGENIKEFLIAIVTQLTFTEANIADTEREEYKKSMEEIKGRLEDASAHIQYVEENETNNTESELFDFYIHSGSYRPIIPADKSKLMNIPFYINVDPLINGKIEGAFNDAQHEGIIM